MGLELTRSDIGFGRVIFDDQGVTRRRLFGASSIAWSEIREYRLRLDLRQFTGDLGHPLGEEAALVTNIVEGARGHSQRRFGIELFGDTARVAFNWRFRNVEGGIAQVLARVHRALTDRARAELEASGVARFGPLGLASHGLQLWDDAPLAREAVESVGLFDASPLQLRVMARGKSRPHSKSAMHEVPNVLSALALAAELGYPVRGRELLAAVTR